MQVRDVMTPEPDVVQVGATLEEAARRMQMQDVGALPVCDGPVLAGMLTDRDITVRATAMGLDPIQATAGQVMTPAVACCYEDQDVGEAARLMGDQQVRRLVVVDRERRLVGIVSLGDLAMQAGDERVAGEVLERVSEPGEPEARHG